MVADIQRHCGAAGSARRDLRLANAPLMQTPMENTHAISTPPRCEEQPG